MTFAQANSISKENFRTELILLKSQLENNHANLYLYHDAKELDLLIDSISSSLDTRIDILEAYHHVSYIAAYIQDGHALVYPSDRVLKQFYNEGPLFPLDLFYNGLELNLIADYSNENSIPIGSEIKTINGTSVDKLYDFMVHHIPRDGKNLQYPTHVFYKFFSAYYSFFFGFIDSFEIEYLDSNQELKTKNIKALPRNAIRKRREEKGHIAKEAISFNIDVENQLAVLKIATFDNNILKDDFHQEFKKEIKSAFKNIRKRKIDNLVIDLRDNQGGELSNGNYLLKQISNRKIKSIYKLEGLKIDKNTNQRLLKKKINFDKFNFLPWTKSYNGQIFLFTNGGSFSCSAIVANEFQKQKLGMIIGEMSGGSASVNGGSPNEIITLPYTKIIFTIPTIRFYLNKNLSIQAKGVIPDVVVKDNYERFIGGVDKYLDEVMILIK